MWWWWWCHCVSIYIPARYSRTDDHFSSVHSQTQIYLYLSTKQMKEMCNQTTNQWQLSHIKLVRLTAVFLLKLIICLFFLRQLHQSAVTVLRSKNCFW